MASGPEVADSTATIIAGALSLGGMAFGYFVSGFLKSFRAPERTEDKRVVLESADLTEPSTMRNVGAKLAEMHPAVLATNQNVAKALVILEAQEHRAAVREEAERLIEQMEDRRRRAEEHDRRENER